MAALLSVLLSVGDLGAPMNWAAFYTIAMQWSWCPTAPLTSRPGDNTDGDAGAVAGGVSIVVVLLVAIALYALWQTNQRDKALRQVAVLSEGHELATLANPVRTNQIDNGIDETIFDGKKPPEYSRPPYLDVAASSEPHPDSRAER